MEQRGGRQCDVGEAGRCPLAIVTTVTATSAATTDMREWLMTAYSLSRRIFAPT